MAAWQIHDLIHKLIFAGIVERLPGQLGFTKKFCNYYIEMQNDIERGASLPWWRDSLSNFSPSLCLLSEKEIAATVVLFDYFLRHENSIKEETNGI